MRVFRIAALVIGLACTLMMALVFTDFWMDGKCIMIEDNLFIRAFESVMILYGVIGLSCILVSAVRNKRQ